MTPTLRLRLRRCLSLHLLALFLPLLFLGTSALAAAGGKLRVVTTFAPITSLTLNVAGEAADVEQLLPPGAEPHDFALAPSDLRKLNKADVVVINGAGFEDWLGKSLRSLKVRQIDASAGVRLVDDNPHVWLDPVIAIAQVENIRKGLAERDPANAATYNANAKAFTARLKALDGEIRRETKRLRDKKLLTVHDAFRYFANRYGFEVVGVIEELPGRDPSPRALKALREVIIKRKVKALFTEPQGSPQIVRSLSQDLQIPIVEIDPMELGEPSAALYETVTRRNLERLKEGLGGNR